MSEVDEQDRKIEPAQWSIVALVVALTAGGILYKVLKHQQLGHSAAMFLGVPAVLAIVLALAPRAKTVTGGILKGITLALLVVAPLLGEGFVCILLASPLFYVVGIVVGIAMDAQRKRRGVMARGLILFLLPMCCEGVVPGLTFDRAQCVEVTTVVAGRAEEVERVLTKSPDIETRLPLTLRIGFPRPLAARGEGLDVGDTRTIHFAGAEGAPAGDLVMRVAERRPGFARFETVSDQTKLSQWMHWCSSEVTWTPLDVAHTTVTWRIDFTRELDPAWYFTPWERAAVRQAASYLIDANATPARRK